MCFGGGPKAPEIKYEGPSEEDIRRNEEQLAQYQQQMSQQQTAFQEQLQAQIDAANTEYSALEQQLSDAQAAQEQAKQKAAADLAAAAASGVAQQGNAGLVTVQQSEPTNAQETKAIKDKKKPNSSLKIASNAIEATAGTGLNIGV